MYQFTATIKIIGVNPFIFIPPDILALVFVDAGKHKGPIPIKGTINGNPYIQTILRFQGEWRLYINTTMLKNSPQRIGETIELSIAYDPTDRSITPHPKLIATLNKNPKVKKIFNELSPSLRKEIIRYIDQLKSEETVEKNITKAIAFLQGEGRFIGRDHP